MTFNEWYNTNIDSEGIMDLDMYYTRMIEEAWNAAIEACQEQLNKDTYYDSEGYRIHPSVDLYGLKAM